MNEDQRQMVYYWRKQAYDAEGMSILDLNELHHGGKGKHAGE